MKTEKTMFCAVLILATGFAACTGKSNATSQSNKVDTTINKTEKSMTNFISIVEIPTTDFPRAVKFYQSILGVSIEEVDMGGTKMGVLPGDEEAVNVVLVKGDDYKPTTDGAVVYINAGKNLQPTLDKIETSGGKVIVPKTEISPEMGYFALFMDTEGNKLGLHSKD
ncbi:MAG TPA: VOC family protein [Segetibacter sp.]